MIRLLEERRFPGWRRSSSWPRSGARARRSSSAARHIRSSARRPRRSRASTSSCRARRPAISRQWSPIAAAGRRRRRRQLERLPDGPRRSAGRPRGQPARRRPAPGDHRQPQLLDDPDGRRPQAAARRLPGAPGGRQHVPIGLGRRAEGNARAQAQTGPHVATRSRPPRPSSPTRSRQLHPPDRRLPARAATRRKK